MKNIDLYLKNLTGKDENAAMEAATYMIENSDKELFQLLVDKTEFLFYFIRCNVQKRIEKAINTNNFTNIINFFDIYSVYYDDLFANILAKHANEDITDKIFVMLEKGSIAQKTYAAKYFSLIHDTVALEPLSKYAFCDDEYLSYNAAEALGQMQDDISFDIALSSLDSNDDFERLKAVKFFVAYGRNYPFRDIFKAMTDSKMPENISGEIPYMESLLVLLNSEFRNETLDVIDNIISGLGEILPICEIFQYEIYDLFEYLITLNMKRNENASKIATILLSAYSKFKMFCENQEYIFDEDKDTKHEVNSVLTLLQAQNNDFWLKQKQLVVEELISSKKMRVLSAINVIEEYKLTDAVTELKKLTDCDDEIIICEALNALSCLGALDEVNIPKILDKIENQNIKAIIENLKA